MSLLYFQEEERLKTVYFDEYDQIKPSAILDLFQDAAGIHANLIGVGFDDMVNRGYYWILVRTEFEIIKNPKPLSKVKIATWPHQKSRIDANREYAILDSDDNLLVKGISKWVVININTRRLSRLDDINYNGEYYNINNYVDIAKIKLPEACFKHVYTYKVCKKDIDHNKHMNNSKYADIIFEVYDNRNPIKNMTIEYIKESKKDDIIDLYEYEENNKIYYLGKNNDEKLFMAVIGE